MEGSDAQRGRRGALFAGALACLAGGCALAREAGRGSSPGNVPALESAREPFEVRLWRAGRPIHPGLSAGREAELQADRVREVAALARGTSSRDDQRWKRWLEASDTPDELWCAAARAAAALARYDFAPFLTHGLKPAASPRRAVAARAALHELYGSWFQHASELEPFLAKVEGGAGTRLLVASIRREEERARARLLAELAPTPTLAASWLDDPDPEIRSGAARLLGRAFTQDGVEAGAALEVLIARLESEHEPRAFHEGIQAACAPLERAPADDPRSLRLRAVLIDIARQEGEPRSLSAAQAIARLPWRKDGPRDLGHILSGVEALGAILRGLDGADERRGVNDPDPLVIGLAALRQLSEQAVSLGLASELRVSPARTSLLAVLDDAHQDPAARTAAAAALAPLARASDGPALAALLEDPALAAPVKHALLGTLRVLFAEFQPGDAGARELLAAVAAQTEAADADLRRKALALLTDPRLENLVRSLDPAFLVECLERDEGRDVTLALLLLLQRFGGVDLLQPMLALERFDALCSDPATLDAVVSVLQRLAGRRAMGVMAAAERLADARGGELGLARLRHALALVAGLEDSAAFALAPEHHRAIRAWVWRATRAGVAPRDLAPDGLAFEQRLLTIHLPLGETLEDGSEDAGHTSLGPFEGAHLVALLRSDVFLGAAAGLERGSKQEVEGAFESALSRAHVEDLRWLVLRDRARFRAAANECVKALGDYRRLAQVGSRAEGLLGIPDLRSAVELLGRLDEAGGKGSAASAGEACELLGRLIERRAWRAEPASVRMQDLRNWVRLALDSSDAQNLRRVESVFSDLPLTQVEAQNEREPNPIWFGLTRESAWFQELLDLRVQARLGLRALEARG